MKKKQGTSGNEKKMSARNWADSVTISENPNQGGIELRFNAEPSPELQPKLRAMGFRHSKSQVMWYGENTGQAIEFARQLEGVISTSSDGPELFLSPSFDAVKTNIEKKEFSYVMISLKDGQVKNYLVFEPSKPKAEVIANNFARKEFGDQFLVLAAKPRLHVKEARILFDEGRIIFPEGQDIPTHKKSSIKGLVKTSPETSTKETSEKENDKIPLREIHLTTKDDNQLPLYKEGKAYSAWSGADLFVKGLIGKFSDVYYKAIWQDGETLEGSVDLEPKDFYEGKEEILSSHVQYFLGRLSKEKPNILYSTKAIEKAKKILNGYQLQETPATVTSRIQPELNVDKQREIERLALDKFYKWATLQPNLSQKPSDVTRELFDKWFKDNYPELSAKRVESIWQSHSRIIKSFKRFEKRSTGKGVMQPYSSIYNKLMKIIPNLLTHIQEGKYHGKSVKDPKGGLMDFNYDYVGKDKDGNPIVALSHYYEQNGDLVPDPDMQIRILPELEAAEAMTFQDYRKYQEVYPDKGDGKKYVYPKLKKDLNQFLNQWLSNVIQQGHKIDLSQVESEETEEEVILDNSHSETNSFSKPEFERLHTPEEETKIVEQFLAQGFKRPFSAQEAFDNKLPVIDLAFRYVEAMEYFRDHIENPHKEKIKKLRQDLKDLQGKVTHVKRNSLKEEIEQLEAEMNFAEKLVQDESLIFQDDLFAIILQKAKDKGFANQIGKDVSSFRDYVVTNVLDNRAIENYHTQPVNEVVDELIAEYFNRDENTFDMRSNPTTTPKSIATDLKSGDTFLPNVLVPSGTTEPFHSHLFQLYDTKEVIKNNFPHLLKINNDNLNSASPLAMFELIQFGHPSEYGIDVNRQDLLKEWEKRGKSIFKEIGFPTDEIYPYVNLHTGYESVEPFKEMLYDNNPEGDEWWAIAEHSRPVADAKKALKIIDQMIEKEKQEMKTYLNPKTGKPKLESKHLVRDIELTIEHFEDSKAVLQHYLDNPPEAGAEDKEEINEDPLANENGVYTEKTAGDNYEKIEIPMPKGAQFEASVSIVKTSKSDYVVGLHAAKKFGDSEGLAFPASIDGQSYSTREEALKYGLKFLDIRLAVLQAGKDTILGNEEKKNKQLNMAQEALKKFAEENNISLENNSATPGKISVKEIHLTTTEKKGKADYSKAIVVNNWIDANDVLRKQQWKKAPTLYFKVVWSDGETFERSLDEGNAGLYSSKRYPLSDFIYQYNLTVSKMKPLKGSSITEADVKKAKKLIEGYIFSDTTEANVSAGIIKGLEDTYWTKEDNKYPVNKAIINGMEFDQARLREAIRTKLEKLPIATLEEIVKELSLKFQERRPLATYEKSLVTIGKTGDKRKATLIASYVDDMVVDHDLNQKGDYAVLTFLIELLFKDEQKLVDLPQNIERSSAPKGKKQSQYDLNKEIEAFIDKKDKEGSFFNEEEKNYIRQYTGSGGLLKEGATGRGALYEYYTPELVVKKMWEMAYHFGYDGGSILEPSVGTGNFLKYAPKGAPIFGFETNHYSARIAQVLFPHAHINEKAFETLFFAGNIHLKDKFENPGYSLAIGNPPYGEFTGKYAGMGEKQYTGATEYDQYFMLRGLDLLKKDGLLVYLIPSSFMSNGSKFNKVKEKIAAKADFMDCYRLPTRIFDTTDIGTDILVLRKNK